MSVLFLALCALWVTVCAQVQFVAVGVPAGATSGIVTSLDGLSWTAATLTGGSLSSGLCVAFSQEQSRWVVGGQPGTVSIASAADGATLSFSGVGGSQNVLSRVNGVVWSGTPLNIWVAAGQQGNGANTGPIAWSTDAVTWTNIQGGNLLFNIATGVAWSPTRGLFIATGQAALSGVAFSGDGRTWAPSPLVPLNTNNCNNVVWAPQPAIYVAVCSAPNLVITSNSGNGAWTRATNLPAFGSTGLSVAWSGTTFVAGGDITGGRNIATSTDGNTWTMQNTDLLNTRAAGATWSQALGTFIVAGFGGNSLIKSTDGATWQAGVSTISLLSQGLGVASRIGAAPATTAPTTAPPATTVVAGGTTPAPATTAAPGGGGGGGGGGTTAPVGGGGGGTTAAQSGDFPIAAVIGGVVGGIILIGLIILVVAILMRRRHAKMLHDPLLRVSEATEPMLVQDQNQSIYATDGLPRKFVL